MHWIKVTASVTVLLALVIISGLMMNSSLEKSALQLEGHINRIETAAAEEDWDMVQLELSHVKQKWEGMEELWTLLLYHIEIDNITMALSKMENYIKAKDKTMTLGEAALLKQYIRHIPQKEAFSLENIF